MQKWHTHTHQKHQRQPVAAAAHFACTNDIFVVWQLVPRSLAVVCWLLPLLSVQVALLQAQEKLEETNRAQISLLDNMDSFHRFPSVPHTYKVLRSSSNGMSIELNWIYTLLLLFARIAPLMFGRKTETTKYCVQQKSSPLSKQFCDCKENVYWKIDWCSLGQTHTIHTTLTHTNNGIRKFMEFNYFYSAVGIVDRHISGQRLLRIAAIYVHFYLMIFIRMHIFRVLASVLRVICAVFGHFWISVIASRLAGGIVPTNTGEWRHISWLHIFLVFFFFLVRCAAQHSFIHSFGVCCVAQHSVYCLYASNGVCFVFSVYIGHLPAVAGSTTPLNKIHSECVVMVHRCRCEASKQAKKMAKPKIPPCLLLTHTQYAAQPSATKQRDS